MRYDAESRIIGISLCEFVSIARRGISPTVSYDEDEPGISAATISRLERLFGTMQPYSLRHEFTDGGIDFCLTGVAEAACESGITVARVVSGNPQKPKKSEVAEIRGEGYVAAYMYARERGLDTVELRLIYLGPSGSDYAERTESLSISKLESFFNKCLVAVRIFASPEIERVSERLPTLKRLRFPYDNVREGQSEFVRSAYRTISRGGCLYATAPTGTGKTVSALYPALRALGDGRVEKIFYLTPKTTTAEAARDCLELISSQGGRLCAVILTAKERICPNKGLCRRSHRFCNRSACNKIAEAALALWGLNKPVVGAEDILKVADEYTVCPYELSLTYAELCDVVICDFNYLFDPTVYIRRFFTQAGKYAFLIDEAHNLHERAREMYSAEISLIGLDAPAEEPMLGSFSAVKKMCRMANLVFSDTLVPYLKDELRRNFDGRLVGAAELTEIPARLYTLFDELLAVVENEILINQRATDEESFDRLSYLRAYYYKHKKFADAMARFDSSYRLFVFYDDGDVRAEIYCLDTSPAIRTCLNKGHGAVLFSATLSPLDYYRSVLGGERSDEMLEVSSPFDPSQLSVCIMDRISTRISERDDTMMAVTQAVAATVSAKRGNYMVFCPSFLYAQQLCNTFMAKYPKINVMLQRQDMSLKEKEEFLAEFKKSKGNYLIAFCVMGGIYAEGIDLAGEELIGAVIVGIGMPALTYEREAISAYYQDKYEEGKQYAYIYPGMNRVFQAAGRVIRREDDRGVIVLVDDRFDDPIYRKSLPKLWEGVKFIDTARNLRAELDEFWGANEEKSDHH